MAIRTGSLPNNTSIKELGYGAAAISKLTPAILKLNKGDLLALQKWAAAGGKGKAPDHLKIQDLNALRKAFGPIDTMASKKNAVVGDNVNCCCTPCCCCSAAGEIEPVARR